MNSLNLSRCAAGAFVAAILLIACGGSERSVVPASGVSAPLHNHTYPGKSWMSPAAKHTQYLLYVSALFRHRTAMRVFVDCAGPILAVWPPRCHVYVTRGVNT